MATTVDEIRLEGDTRGVIRELRKLNRGFRDMSRGVSESADRAASSVEGLSGSVISLNQAWELGERAVGAVQSIWSSTVGVAQEVRRSTNQVSEALQAHGISSEAAIVTLERYRDELVRTAGVQREQADEALQLTASFTRGQDLQAGELTRLSQLVIDVAAATNDSLEGVAKTLGEVRSGELDALLTDLPGLADEMERIAEEGGGAAEILQLVEDEFGGAAAAAADGQTAMAQWQAAVEDLQVAIGEGLADAAAEAVAALAGLLRDLGRLRYEIENLAATGERSRGRDLQEELQAIEREIEQLETGRSGDTAWDERLRQQGFSTIDQPGLLEGMAGLTEGAESGAFGVGGPGPTLRLDDPEVEASATAAELNRLRQRAAEIRGEMDAALANAADLDVPTGGGGGGGDEFGGGGGGGGGGATRSGTSIRDLIQSALAAPAELAAGKAERAADAAIAAKQREVDAIAELEEELAERQLEVTESVNARRKALAAERLASEQEQLDELQRIWMDSLSQISSSLGEFLANTEGGLAQLGESLVGTLLGAVRQLAGPFGFIVDLLQGLTGGLFGGGGDDDRRRPRQDLVAADALVGGGGRPGRVVNVTINNPQSRHDVRRAQEDYRREAQRLGEAV